MTDITYIPTDEGWLYLAGIKDLFNGELVGYATSERMTKELVMQAVFRAVAAKRPAKGLLHHSDRGSQPEFNRLSQRIVLHAPTGALGKPQPAFSSQEFCVACYSEH